MQFSSQLFLRVEPTMPGAIAAAARARGIGGSEFIRRAIIQALSDGVFRVENRKPRGPSRRKLRKPHLVTGQPERDPPPPMALAGALPVAA